MIRIEWKWKKWSDPWTLEEWRALAIIATFFFVLSTALWFADLRTFLRCQEHMWFVHAMEAR